jgi:hypothetical protein
MANQRYGTHLRPCLFSVTALPCLVPRPPLYLLFATDHRRVTKSNCTALASQIKSPPCHLCSCRKRFLREKIPASFFFCALFFFGRLLPDIFPALSLPLHLRTRPYLSESQIEISSTLLQYNTYIIHPAHLHNQVRSA